MAISVTTSATDSTGAEAMATIGGVITSTLPSTTGSDPYAAVDGSAGAPVGTAQNPTLLNTYHAAAHADKRVYGSGPPNYGLADPNYYQPPWWVPGVDYYVGIDRSKYPTDASLKDPATIVSGVTFGPGTTVSGQELTIGDNNVTVDGYDFSLENSWSIHWNSGISGTTISNCKFVMGSNTRPFLWDNTSNKPANLTVINNYIDGNNKPFTTNNSSSSGTATLHFASTAGITTSHTAWDITTPSATGGATGITVLTVNPTSIVLSSNLGANVGNGDLFVFGIFPIDGGLGTCVYTVKGAHVIKYNYYTNSWAVHTQLSPEDTTGASLTVKYNFFGTSGWGALIHGNHGDNIQAWGQDSTTIGWDTVDCEFNFTGSFDPTATAQAQPFSIMDASTNISFIGTLTIGYNTNLWPGTSGQTNTAVVRTSGGYTKNTINLLYNYYDPTGASQTGAGKWGSIANDSITAGPFTPTLVNTGNTNMVDGTNSGPPAT